MESTSAAVNANCSTAADGGIASSTATATSLTSSAVGCATKERPVPKPRRRRLTVEVKVANPENNGGNPLQQQTANNPNANGGEEVKEADKKAANKLAVPETNATNVPTTIGVPAMENASAVDGHITGDGGTSAYRSEINGGRAKATANDSGGHPPSPAKHANVIRHAESPLAPQLLKRAMQFSSAATAEKNVTKSGRELLVGRAEAEKEQQQQRKPPQLRRSATTLGTSAAATARSSALTTMIGSGSSNVIVLGRAAINAAAGKANHQPPPSNRAWATGNNNSNGRIVARRMRATTTTTSETAAAAMMRTKGTTNGATAAGGSSSSSSSNKTAASATTSGHRQIVVPTPHSTTTVPTTTSINPITTKIVTSSKAAINSGKMATTTTTTAAESSPPFRQQSTAIVAASSSASAHSSSTLSSTNGPNVVVACPPPPTTTTTSGKSSNDADGGGDSGQEAAKTTTTNGTQQKEEEEQNQKEEDLLLAELEQEGSVEARLIASWLGSSGNNSSSTKATKKSGGKMAVAELNGEKNKSREQQRQQRRSSAMEAKEGKEEEPRPRFSLDNLVLPELQQSTATTTTTHAPTAKMETTTAATKSAAAEIWLRRPSPRGQCRGTVFVHWHQAKGELHCEAEAQGTRRQCQNGNEEEAKMNGASDADDKENTREEEGEERTYGKLMPAHATETENAQKPVPPPRPRKGQQHQQAHANRISLCASNNNQQHLSASPPPRRAGVTMLEQLVKSHPVWFLPHLDRQAACHFLASQPPGVFIVRASSRTATTNSGLSSPNAANPSNGGGKPALGRSISNSNHQTSTTTTVMALSVRLPSSSPDVVNNTTPSHQQQQQQQEEDQQQHQPLLLDHFLLEAIGPGQSVRLEGSPHVFASLPLLLEHYSDVEQAVKELKCALRLPPAIAACETIQSLQAIALMGQDFWTSSLASTAHPHQHHGSGSSPSQSSIANSSAAAGSSPTAHHVFAADNDPIINNINGHSCMPFPNLPTGLVPSSTTITASAAALLPGPFPPIPPTPSSFSSTSFAQQHQPQMGSTFHHPSWQQQQQNNGAIPPPPPPSFVPMPSQHNQHAHLNGHVQQQFCRSPCPSACSSTTTATTFGGGSGMRLLQMMQSNNEVEEEEDIASIYHYDQMSTATDPGQHPQRQQQQQCCCCCTHCPVYNNHQQQQQLFAPLRKSQSVQSHVFLPPPPSHHQLNYNIYEDDNAMIMEAGCGVQCSAASGRMVPWCASPGSQSLREPSSSHKKSSSNKRRDAGFLRSLFSPSPSRRKADTETTMEAEEEERRRRTETMRTPLWEEEVGFGGEGGRTQQQMNGGGQGFPNAKQQQATAQQKRYMWRTASSTTKPMVNGNNNSNGSGLALLKRRQTTVADRAGSGGGQSIFARLKGNFRRTNSTILAAATTKDDLHANGAGKMNASNSMNAEMLWARQAAFRRTNTDMGGCAMAAAMGRLRDGRGEPMPPPSQQQQQRRHFPALLPPSSSTAAAAHCPFLTAYNQFQPQQLARVMPQPRGEHHHQQQINGAHNIPSSSSSCCPPSILGGGAGVNIIPPTTTATADIRTRRNSFGRNNQFPSSQSAIPTSAASCWAIRQPPQQQHQRMMANNNNNATTAATDSQRLSSSGGSIASHRSSHHQHHHHHHNQAAVVATVRPQPPKMFAQQHDGAITNCNRIDCVPQSPKKQTATISAGEDSDDYEQRHQQHQSEYTHLSDLVGSAAAAVGGADDELSVAGTDFNEPWDSNAWENLLELARFGDAKVDVSPLNKNAPRESKQRQQQQHKRNHSFSSDASSSAASASSSNDSTWRQSPSSSVEDGGGAAVRMMGDEEDDKHQNASPWNGYAARDVVELAKNVEDRDGNYGGGDDGMIAAEEAVAMAVVLAGNGTLRNHGRKLKTVKEWREGSAEEVGEQPLPIALQMKESDDGMAPNASLDTLILIEQAAKAANSSRACSGGQQRIAVGRWSKEQQSHSLMDIPNSTTQNFGGGIPDANFVPDRLKVCDVGAEENRQPQQQRSANNNGNENYISRVSQRLPNMAICSTSMDELSNHSRSASICPSITPVLSPSRLRNGSHENPGGEDDPARVIQRYVETLSTDDQTIFCATLQRFVECTLLSREQDPYIVIRRVRQFLDGMINYLTTSGEGDLLGLIQTESERLRPNEFLNLTAILEAVLDKILLIRIKAQLYRLMILESTKNGELGKLSENLALVRSMNPTDLGFPEGTQMPDAARMEQISKQLRKMQNHYSPLKKLQLLLRALALAVPHLPLLSSSEIRQQQQQALQSHSNSTIMPTQSFSNNSIVTRERMKFSSGEFRQQQQQSNGAIMPMPSFSNNSIATRERMNSAESSSQGTGGNAAMLKHPPADELIRWLVYLLARSSTINCEIEAWYMWELLSKEVLSTGDATYFMSILFSAVHVLKHPDSVRRLKNMSMPAGHALPNVFDFLGSQSTLHEQDDANNNSSDLLLRVAIPNEQMSSIEYHTFPVLPKMNAAKLCRVIAHQFSVSTPEDYGLYLIVEGNPYESLNVDLSVVPPHQVLLQPHELPHLLRDKQAGKPHLFVYKRHDARITIPRKAILNSNYCFVDGVAGTAAAAGIRIVDNNTCDDRQQQQHAQ